MSRPYKLTWNYTNPREYLRLYEKFEMPPLIITCAITGGWQGKEANPNLPETPEEQAKSTFEAYEAGASIVHVHARDPKKGYADAVGSKEIYYDINKRIRELCPDIIINNTTGGGPGMNLEERLQSAYAKPEMCSLNMGTMVQRGLVKARIGGLSGRDRDVEVETVFKNTYSDTERFAKVMLENNVKPEMETFQDGNWSLIDNLIDKQLVKPPYWVCLVPGMQSATPPTPWHILNQIAYAPPNTMFNIIGIGVHQLPLTTFAMLIGLHIRVGMEDNVYYARGVKAKSNAELVARAVRIAKELNRPVATPTEAREMLGISKTPTKY
ncbi:3-keto-5-aminohexanoate cleavage protein [Candidatus Bathyarchaeota archaeon]|nr:3-keto-5-aminohexanoate cleavage protein [Candidatus Bathyarchaeota archaeon]